MSKKEQVVAVRNHKTISGFAIATESKYKKGFSPIPEYLSLEDIFDAEDVMLGSRAWLEEDENFLQLIPYTLVASSSGKVLAYSRTPKGGEDRLHGKVSVGWGGHINADDVSASRYSDGTMDIITTVFNAVDRELAEELQWNGTYDEPILEDSSFEFSGLLYNPGDAVGRVHLGLLLIAPIDPTKEDTKHLIDSPDEGITVLGFFDAEYLLTAEEINLEPWSRMALEGLKCL